MPEDNAYKKFCRSLLELLRHKLMIGRSMRKEEKYSGRGTLISKKE
jgi:hypothetical protein